MQLTFNHQLRHACDNLAALEGKFYTIERQAAQAGHEIKFILNPYGPVDFREDRGDDLCPAIYALGQAIPDSDGNFNPIANVWVMPHSDQSGVLCAYFSEEPPTLTGSVSGRLPKPSAVMANDSNFFIENLQPITDAIVATLKTKMGFDCKLG